jgi:hypothetical protein
MTHVTPWVHVLAGYLVSLCSQVTAVLLQPMFMSLSMCKPRICMAATSVHVSTKSAGVQVAVLTNGSVDGVAKPALTAGGAIQLLKGPLLDINMAQVWV